MGRFNASLLSSQREEYSTPPRLFEEWNRKFGFTLDVCASKKNAKCAWYFSRKDDGLSKSWSGICWMNPPYGRGISSWVRKAWEESREGVVVVGLLPVRTDTAWFQDYVLGKARLHFLRGRLRFEGTGNMAPFPSVVAVWRRGA